MFFNGLSGLLIATALSTSVYANAGAGAGFQEGANAYANARNYSNVNYKQPVQINFGVYSDDQATSVVRTYMPALKSLERSMTIKLGTPVDIRMHIASDHKQGLDHLINQEVDFKALDTQDYLEMKQTGVDLRILVSQNTVHTNLLSPWVTRAGLDGDIHEALKDSLLNLQNRKILSGMEILGFVQSHESQFTEKNQTNSVANNLSEPVKSGLTNPMKVSKKNTLTAQPPILGAAQSEHIELESTFNNSKQNNTQSDLSINIAFPRELLKQAERPNQSRVNVVIDLNKVSTPASSSLANDY